MLEYFPYNQLFFHSIFCACEETDRYHPHEKPFYRYSSYNSQFRFRLRTMSLMSLSFSFQPSLVISIADELSYLREENRQLKVSENFLNFESRSKKEKRRNWAVLCTREVASFRLLSVTPYAPRSHSLDCPLFCKRIIFTILTFHARSITV